MDSRHPETELIAYQRDELAPAARESVARHLEGCAQCRDTLTAFRGLLDDVGRAGAAVPDVHWPRYRAELRTRLEEKTGRRSWTWWRSPLPIALSAGVAAALLVAALVPTVWRTERVVRTSDNVAGLEDVMVGGRLDLLREYSVVERLDLLEDLDVIRQLDGLTDRREG